jgi:hypothetical protein
MGRFSVGTVTLILLLTTVGSAQEPTAPAASIRLAWDPNPEPEVVGYRVHVGVLPGIYDQTFDAGSRTEFIYLGGESGRRYYFAVSALKAGRIEGPRSTEVSAVAGAFRATQAGVLSNGRGTTQDSASQPEQRVASPLGTISAMAALDNGRLLIIENRRDIHVISGDGREVRLAFGSDRPERRRVALAVDPAFARNHFVYLGLIEAGSRGDEFSVMRFRELNDSLGEGAVVVGGLPVRGNRDPAFAVDGKGRIYVALPSDDTRDHPYAQAILRFAADGSADGSREFSPVLTRGLAEPVALDWDGFSMWAVGSDRGPSRVDLIQTDLRGDDDTGVLRRSQAKSPLSAEVADDVTAFDASSSIDGLKIFAWLDSHRRLHLLRMQAAQEVKQRVSLAFEDDDWPTAVVVDSSGDVRVAIRRPGGQSAVIRIPIPSPQPR